MLLVVLNRHNLAFYPLIDEHVAEVGVFEAAKLGFTEVEQFEDYGAEQWFGVRSPVPSSG